MSESLLRATKEDRKKFRENYIPIKFKRWQSSLHVPKGLKLLSHQEACALYSLNRNRSYLGLPTGTGKSIIAALIAGAVGKRTILICPKSLVFNIEAEFRKWCPHLETRVLDNMEWIVPDVLIVPDSVIDRFEVRRHIRWFSPHVVLIDEAHRFKEMSANRTRALLGYRDADEGYIAGIVDRKNLEKLVYMSGTPMSNRPIELYSIIGKSCPEYIDFKNRIQYGLTYCQGFYDGRGYRFDGANEKTLKVLKDSMVSKNAHDRYGFMLRINKDVLKLPPLTEEVVLLGGEKIHKELRVLQQNILKKHSVEDLVEKKILKKLGKKEEEESLHVSTYRRLLGLEKISYGVEFIREILESDPNEKLLIFAIHKEVIAKLGDALSQYSPLIATGDTPVKKREEMKKAFQTDKKRRLFLANIGAMGVGHTLTKATRVIMFEFSWVSGENRQAIDRAHRYGLEHPLLAQYIALKDSLDRPVLEVLQRKDKVTSLI